MTNKALSFRREIADPIRTGMKETKFIDLFAGVGGIRMAMERQGFRCVFSSEWDRFAQKTYHANFGEEPVGDIREVSSKEIPRFDVLCAGFPCQPFSISGVSKKNALGRPHGFEDETQGTLFFDIARIIKEKKPRAFLLENVKNLRSHDKGRTFELIRRTLADELGYHLHVRVINASTVLPQNRERIYIVGFRSKRAHAAFEFPSLETMAGQKSPGIRGKTAARQSTSTGSRPLPRLGDILEKRVPERYHLSDHLWGYLQDYKKKHEAAGNGFGYGLTDRNGTARTLSARYYKDGSEILVPVPGKNPRRLTPRECARLMGFPEEFQIVVSDTQAYKQFGNSVAVPVVEAIARKLREALAGNRKAVGKKDIAPAMPAGKRKRAGSGR